MNSHDDSFFVPSLFFWRGFGSPFEGQKPELMNVRGAFYAFPTLSPQDRHASHGGLRLRTVVVPPPSLMVDFTDEWLVAMRHYRSSLIVARFPLDGFSSGELRVLAGVGLITGT